MQTDADAEGVQDAAGKVGGFFPVPESKPDSRCAQLVRPSVFLLFSSRFSVRGAETNETNGMGGGGIGRLRYYNNVYVYVYVCIPYVCGASLALFSGRSEGVTQQQASLHNNSSAIR